MIPARYADAWEAVRAMRGEFLARDVPADIPHGALRWFASHGLIVRVRHVPNETGRGTVTIWKVKK